MARPTAARLTVENLTGVVVDSWPITSGVPFPAGALHKDGSLRLTRGRTALPLQWEPLALWPDGSVKWALLDFQTGVAKGKSARLILSRGRSPSPPERVSVTKRNGECIIKTGPLRIVLSERDFRLFDQVAVRDDAGRYQMVAAASRRSAGLLVRDGRGVSHLAAHRPVRITCERRGPLRATVAVRGDHVSRSGGRCFSFVLRIHAYAGCDFVKVDHLIVNDNPTGIFTHFDEVALELELAGEVRAARVGGEGPVKTDAWRLLQVDHDHYRLRNRKRARAPGWMSARSQAGCITAAVRDFWQQWPKSLEMDGNLMRLGLCPTLAPGQYDGLEPIEKWYYLFKGRHYRFRSGVAKSHEVWFRFSLQPDAGAAFNAMVQTPLIAAADPRWAAGSGAWGDLAPADERGTAEYDRLARSHFEGLLRTEEVQGHYGLLNWGDWFGERRYNWGNNEYDTGHIVFLQFARTGDARYFHAGRRFARHMADVDVVHAFNADSRREDERIRPYDLPVQVGAVNLHSLGHVGGYYPDSWARRRWPGATCQTDLRNHGHLWNEGMLENYYLTGDRWAREVALQVADNLAAQCKVPGWTFWFGVDPHCGRTGGWPITVLCAAYGATGKRKYLQAAKHIVELALADQDPNCGGWLYSLYGSHCGCRRSHVGMATFITGILLDGMVLYHQATGDERVAESIVRAVDFVLSDTWMERTAEFRYASCPATPPQPANTLMLRALGYAKRLTADPRYAAALRRAWRRLLDTTRGDPRMRRAPQPGPAYGALYSLAHREAPRVLCDL